MKKDSLREIIIQGATELGINLPEGAAASFETYFSFLEKRGREFNLTAITGEEDVARLHFLDSIALLNAANFQNARVIDVGSGAGFPGVPLKIVDPSIELTLLDATYKRVAFLSELCGILEIKAECIHARAEEAACDFDKREQFDIAVSRAVADSNILSELCLPFVRTGGYFVAMKSIGSNDEVAQAGGAIKKLGGDFSGFFDYTIPGTDIAHRAVLIRKTTKTPDIYPRRFARIKRDPL